MPERTSVALSLWVLTPIRLVLNSAHRFVYPFLPVIARGLGIPLESAGTLLAARWGITLATPFTVRAVGSEHRRRLIVAGLGMFAFGALVTTATSVWIGALVGFSAMGLGKALFDISAQAHVADRVPYDRRGSIAGRPRVGDPLATEVQPMARARFLSLMIVALGVGRAVGAFYGPRLYELAGVAADAWVAAAGTVTALAVLGLVVDGPLNRPMPASSGPARRGDESPELAIQILAQAFLDGGGGEVRP